jgi:hypothetical protein
VLDGKLPPRAKPTGQALFGPAEVDVEDAQRRPGARPGGAERSVQPSAAAGGDLAHHAAVGDHRPRVGAVDRGDGRREQRPVLARGTDEGPGAVGLVPDLEADLEP